jgi:hypothetical protein
MILNETITFISVKKSVIIKKVLIIEINAPTVVVSVKSDGSLR